MMLGPACGYGIPQYLPHKLRQTVRDVPHPFLLSGTSSGQKVLRIQFVDGDIVQRREKIGVQAEENKCPVRVSELCGLIFVPYDTQVCRSRLTPN